MSRFCGREFLIYYRDPLLDKICDRILGLGTPAFIKNSERVFVAVNDAFANLFNMRVSDLVGTDGENAELEALLDIDDKERACLVFGEDQVSSFADPFGKGRFRIEMERFTLADGQTFLYCVFGDVRSAAPEKALSPLQTPLLAAVEEESRALQSSLIDGSQFEHLIGVIDVGVCIWSADNKLTYFNEKLREMFRGTVDRLWIGMDLSEVASQSFETFSSPEDAELLANDEARRQWIDERLAAYNQPSSAVYQKLPTGVWIYNVNRRLADGSMIGLRIDVSDMKAREAMLEQHIEEVGLYRELLNRLPVAAFARGSDLRLAVANQAYAELYGRKVEDLIGTTQAELLGELAAVVAEANLDTLINGTSSEREDEITVAGGRIARTIVRTGRLITEKGTPYIVGTVVDISPIRQRELLLKEATEKAESSRQDFENIISAIDVALVVLDRDMNVLLMNEAYKKKIWGKASEDWQGGIVGRPLRDFMYDHFVNDRRVDSNETFEDYYERRVGEIRSGRIHGREALLQNGAAVFYSGIPLSDGKFMLCYVDLTELRKRDAEVVQAHEMAQKAYSLVRSATDTMPEGLMVIEGEFIVFANPSLAAVLNISEHLLMEGGRWDDLFRATALQNPMNDELTIADGIARFREAMTNKKGTSYNFPLDNERWVHLDMRSRDDGQIVILCSDQTTTMRREAELKRLIARAEAADRAKSEFLGNMSLEIRTPMNGILGMAELLAKSALDTRQKAFVEIIMKSGHALLTIINDILDFSKLDAGHMQLKYMPFDPGEALEDVASLLATTASEKDIELLVKRSGDIPAMIMGDAGRFRQIITNLLDNAVKFTEHGFVAASIGTASDGQGQTILNVMIEDTGIGIPAEKLRTIFEKFSQIEINANRREGSGLGLAIAQRLASIQGGTISVHSSENKGSIFTLSLPVQIAAEQSRPKPLPANVEGARILIVDHHDIARNHLLEHANDWGFECVGAADGATGLSILHAAAESGVEVDAVIIDSQMTDMSGGDMARQIRSDPRFHGVAVIFMTSQDIATYEKMVADIKIEAYLTKPIRIPLLRGTLLDVIQAGRARSVTSRRNVTHLPSTPPRGIVSADSPPPDRPYVLVAEDNEVNQIFFSQILESAGIDYRIVENGEAVVAAWQKARPSVILMDTTMPILDGFEATRMIRAIEAMTGGYTPIIGVISHVQDGDAAQCVASGMNDHITKPISPERLEEKIVQWAGADFRLLAVGS
ncbi:MAG: hybrid sensor histidine kinase/response regulator [Rhizobium sp.]|nr:hybrid sensor histidine kinase/response regulator [Rhizobium sp.]